MSNKISEEPLISVIVPVYNVERYLDQCVKSIVEQSYRNLEIILVDDGSRDTCPGKCDTWAVEDNRISVIHKANGGLSSARNAGLDQAQGDLIAFVDSDDWIDPNMLRTMWQWMRERHEVDVVMCGTEKNFEDGGTEHIDGHLPARVFTPDQALHSFLYHTGPYGQHGMEQAIRRAFLPRRRHSVPGRFEQRGLLRARPRVPHDEWNLLQPEGVVLLPDSRKLHYDCQLERTQLRPCHHRRQMLQIPCRKRVCRPKRARVLLHAGKV